MQFQRAETPARLSGHDQAAAFFAACFGAGPGGPVSGERAAIDPYAVEQLFVAHLDDEANCVHLSAHPGTAHAVGLPVRDILRDAVRVGSRGVILAHNHPSGDASPSAEDCRSTRRFALIAEAIDLALVDHMIFAGNKVGSFRRMGLL